MERSIKQQLISWKNKGDFCGIIIKVRNQVGQK